MIRFSSTPKLTSRKESELLVFPYWKKAKKVTPAALQEGMASHLKAPIDAGDFSAELGETALVYAKGKKEPRLLLLGLGTEEKSSAESLRRAYSEVAKLCQRKQLTKLSLLLPTLSQLRKVTAQECIHSICEGILLTNYQFETLCTVDEETVLLKQVQLIGMLPKMMHVVKEAQAVAEGVYFARNLSNGSAHHVTPDFLGKEAKKIAAGYSNVTATVHKRDWIVKQKMGLLEAVSSGAANEARFIILKYQGFPRSKEHTVLVGKGVTYDTGGLNLKPTGHMETMREDMTGGAIALATVATAAKLGLKCNVTAVVPATENAIDANSYKPGDIFTAYSGATVEIGNTDAEGRLILADALSYTQKHLKPSRIIDLATLTGAMVVSLGNEIAGFFANNNTLAAGLERAANSTHELLWRLPLHTSYKKDLKSDSADICNIGGRAAGAIKAALFLEHFVSPKVPWAHIDLAGTTYLDKEFHYWPKQAVGYGVRLLIKFLSYSNA